MKLLLNANLNRDQYYMSLLGNYHKLCLNQHLREDAEQQAAVTKLNLLKQRLESRKRWFSLWPKGFMGQSKPLRGLYIYGGVGRGKTMLMDLFYEHVQIDRKTRYHFHEFMQMLHREAKGFSKGGYEQHPMEGIAKKLHDTSRLICFDEFHFKDITDAMLLKRLFHFLWKEGVVIVATSNFHPEDLYENGYQRNLVLPFLKKLAVTFELCDLGGHTDYRQISQGADNQHVVSDLHTGKQMLWKQFQIATNYAPVTQLELLVNGRSWWVPSVVDRTLFASFDQICGDTVGSQDYLALVERIDRVYLWGVPRLTDEDLDKLKRFITLIDILYDRDTQFVMASETAIEDIYAVGKETTLFERTKSRLTDMLT